jgi:hypothetical protein
LARCIALQVKAPVVFHNAPVDVPPYMDVAINAVVAHGGTPVDRSHPTYAHPYTVYGMGVPTAVGVLVRPVGEAYALDVLPKAIPGWTVTVARGAVRYEHQAPDAIVELRELSSTGFMTWGGHHWRVYLVAETDDAWYRWCVREDACSPLALPEQARAMLYRHLRGGASDEEAQNALSRELPGLDPQVLVGYVRAARAALASLGIAPTAVPLAGFGSGRLLNTDPTTSGWRRLGRLISLALQCALVARTWPLVRTRSSTHFRVLGAIVLTSGVLACLACQLGSPFVAGLALAMQWQVLYFATLLRNFQELPARLSSALSKQLLTLPSNTTYP